MFAVRLGGDPGARLRVHPLRLYGLLVMQFDPLHLWLFLGSAAVLALAVLASGSACRWAGRS